MDIREIEYPIAARNLSLGDETVVVTVGKPELFQDGEDFYCPYSIVTRTSEKFSYAGGVDSIQAIQMALKKIAADLSHLEKKTGGQIQWLDMSETGFP